MRLVADSVGVAPPLPRAEEKTADPLEAYLALARGSAARARRITLAPGWWRRDGPSFAGVTSGDGRPIAVLADGRGRYRAVDPASERSFRVGRREAAGIAAEGVMLYPPFPARARGVAAALGHAVGAVTVDLRTVLFMSVLSSLVGLATPILTGHLLATAIPRSDTPMWVAGLAALLLCALGGAVFQVVQTFALMRIEGRLDERLQCALWSRVLSLPVGFFRQYTAGDLADRLGGGCRPSGRCCPEPPSGPSWAGCSRCRASGCWRTTACASPSSPAGWCWRSSSWVAARNGGAAGWTANGREDRAQPSRSEEPD